VTAADVLRWLPGSGGAEASMIHVGCHGDIRNSPLESRIELTNRQPLTAGRILRQAYRRPADAPGGLVVLGACVSDLTGTHHDEALTVATSFLAAGEASVIGTQWAIPSRPSALLLFMFHHYLLTTHPRPADALRAAQQWMLDPRRAVPAEMPAHLADEISADDPLEDLGGWAAFVHHGW
jgi:CHAT domain-containing protein